MHNMHISPVQFSSVAQSCPTLCDHMNRSTPGLLSITNSRSSLKPMSIQSVMPSSHFILCRPLFLLPPIPPSITVFSNVLHSICQQIWKTQQWAQNWKRSVFIPIPKKGNAKECSNYHTIALISHASKVMLKSLQPRLQQHVNCELPDVQAGFRKGRGTRDQIANIH